MKYQALTAIEESEPEKVAVEEEQESPRVERQPMIDLFLEKTPEARLRVVSLTYPAIGLEKRSVEINEIDHSPGRVSIVFLDPEMKRLEFVVDEIATQRDGLPMAQGDVFIHPALLDPACMAAEHAQQISAVIAPQTVASGLER